VNQLYVEKIGDSNFFMVKTSASKKHYCSALYILEINVNVTTFCEFHVAQSSFFSELTTKQYFWSGGQKTTKNKGVI
jgi:hypothetical protein